MGKAEAFEQSRKRLERAEHELVSHITLAEGKIAKLKTQHARAAERSTVATKRLQEVKKLSKRLCDECWSVLPAVGQNFVNNGGGSGEDNNIKGKNGKTGCSSSKYCIACGLSLKPRSEKAIDMPSRCEDVVAGAMKARIYAETVIKGNSNVYDDRHYEACLPHRVREWSSQRTLRQEEVAIASEESSSYSGSDISSSSSDSDTCIYWGTTTCSDSDHESSNTPRSTKPKGEASASASSAHYNNKHKIPSKASLIETASKSAVDAKSRVATINTVLEEWTKYHAQHKTELQLLRGTRRELIDREKKMLQIRLSKIDGEGTSSTRSRSSSSSKGSRGGGNSKKRSEDTDNERRTSAKSKSATASKTKQHCIICMETHQREIAFQCGHRCCGSCSKRLSQCHVCRKTIHQRIKLF